ncbi:response regulator transcription factor [Dinghuibacter silviterrae]|uniref:DNA-binding response OmpR family regulator n=1 Tax=Dinghuibacter silviterrae TaxID=1539049 RepID=A0A4R8DGT0_9BACT|nr:response regulator transcription factor [Dinghuibacter silviterrae]TDW96891.1 DNA-binding response OmpR family regulator [Dinghuibacter silviterrae]
MQPKTLLVEDEIDLGTVVKQYLDISDFATDLFPSAHTALQQLREHPDMYQIAILDITMPDMDGFELATRILDMGLRLPFIFLTARNEKKDRLRGLRIGADDYIVKPFDVDELVLRMRNIIRRRTDDDGIVQRGDVRFYKEGLKLRVGEGDEIILTPKESELLDFLFRHQNRVLKREDILNQLWGDSDYFLGRSLDVFISRLRKYLNASRNIRIQNVYGVGFLFNVSHSES